MHPGLECLLSTDGTSEVIVLLETSQKWPSGHPRCRFVLLLGILSLILSVNWYLPRFAQYKLLSLSPFIVNIS